MLQKLLKITMKKKLKVKLLLVKMLLVIGIKIKIKKFHFFLCQNTVKDMDKGDFSLYNKS